MRTEAGRPFEASEPVARPSSGHGFGRTLLELTWLFLRHPVRGADAIGADPRALALGAAFLLIGLATYALVAARIYALGHHPPTTPITLIRATDWYAVQSLITVPVGFVAAFAFSGIAYAICRAFGGRGTFDATFGASAFSLHLPMLIMMWLPEILIAPRLYAGTAPVLPWPSWIELLRIFLIPLPWAGVVSTLALARIHRLCWYRASVAVFIGALPTSLVTAAFLR